MFLTTCTLSTFTTSNRVLSLSGHQNCLAAARSVTFILHLLPASALSAIPTRSNWPLQSSRARVGTVRKDTTWPSMLTTTASTALPGFRWKTPTLPHSLHEHCNTEWRCPSHQSTPSATRSSRAAFARTTSAAGYIHRRRAVEQHLSRVQLFTRAKPLAAGDASGRRCTWIGWSTECSLSTGLLFLVRNSTSTCTHHDGWVAGSDGAFAGVTSFQDTDVSEFVLFVRKIFTSDTRVRRSRQYTLQ